MDELHVMELASLFSQIHICIQFTALPLSKIIDFIHLNSMQMTRRLRDNHFNSDQAQVQWNNLHQFFVLLLWDMCITFKWIYSVMYMIYTIFSKLSSKKLSTNLVINAQLPRIGINMSWHSDKVISIQYMLHCGWGLICKELPESLCNLQHQ